MRKSVTIDHGDVSYKGHCPTCGEVYIVKSSADDLEGLVLSCKKVGCSGRIGLSVDFLAKKNSKSASKTRRLRFS